MKNNRRKQRNKKPRPVKDYKQADLGAEKKGKIYFRSEKFKFHIRWNELRLLLR